MENDFSFITDRLNDPIEYLSGTGRCIYCGYKKHSEKRTNLADEHIIPYAVGGKILIREASCGHCEGITSNVDGWFGRRLLGTSRAIAGFPTRRKSSQQQIILTEVLQRGIFVLQSIDIKELPFVASMPIFPVARVLANRQPINFFPPASLKTAIVTGKPNSLWHKGAIKTVCHYNPTAVSRLLAKIAHAYVSGKVPAKNFIPTLLPFIFATSNAYTYYIGGSKKPGVTVSDKLHDIEMFKWTIKGCRYYVVRIQLFALPGLPAYDVVAGVVTD